MVVVNKEDLILYLSNEITSLRDDLDYKGLSKLGVECCCAKIELCESFLNKVRGNDFDKEV